MKRKIVRHGSSSLTITLPSKWVKKFGLNRGDEVNVEESGPELVVSTEQETASQKKVVSVTDYGLFTKNSLSHLYQLGYDEIEIIFNDNKTLEEIKSRLPECIGFEIIDQKENRVFIKSIATTIESEFDTLLRKSFLITNEMAKDMLKALDAGQYEKLREIRNMESLNNKFTDVCIRILSKRGYKVAKRTMQIYDVLKTIERITDEFKYICDLFSGFKGKIDKSLMGLFRESIDYYLAFYSMFYKFDPELKKRIYLERKKLVRKYETQLETSRGAASRFLHHMIEIVEKTYNAAGGYFALML
ncbi:phosphate uptake regulator PhoU [Candidatus Woesearchaeota archaeon]|nr:phosphate uptake regulator PhoU [Candidatus Woesearchaeota archaeon]